jgi:preprotein translocase subunit SecF
MYNIVGKRYWLFLISGIVILIGIISMATPFGRLKLGTEFSSGSQLRINFEQQVNQSDLRQELAGLGYPNAIIRNEVKVGSQGDFIIRTPQLNDTGKTALVNDLKEKFGNAEVKGFTNVSPEVATKTLRATAIAVLIAAIGMLFYIVWAFRTMPHPFRYGSCAIIALLHDIVVAVGMFSLIGGFLGWEVDMMFMAGILTIIGFSADNTVVIFDRIRENLKMGISTNFETIVNDSILGTMTRCINTSLVVTIVLLALLFFVGATIQNFVVVMLVGVVAGTFDSICVAPMLLVVWEKGEWGRFIGRRAEGRAGATK